MIINEKENKICGNCKYGDKNLGAFPMLRECYNKKKREEYGVTIRNNFVFASSHKACKYWRAK